jgi:hypothetical protein|tara:strand:+ start:478 stop:696 length:219 start_codon:yes stop_codon:yes gene_type:complete
VRILIKGSLRILAVLTLATVPAPAVLVSSGNLGTFALGGSVNIIEDPGANNADWYPGVVFFLDWRNKLVCEF